jgi:hypothetical protein
MLDAQSSVHCRDHPSLTLKKPCLIIVPITKDFKATIDHTELSREPPLLEHRGEVDMSFWKRREVPAEPSAAQSALDSASRHVDAVSQFEPRAPEPQWTPAAEHAAMFLARMQAPDGRTGYISHRELADAYLRAASEHGLQPHSWTAIARELRRLIPQPKRYVGSKRIRMWHIPPATPTLATVTGHSVSRRVFPLNEQLKQFRF